ncbi:MAG: ATP-binding protein, partial [Bdellovibrionales bacterium]|nr:ATP-binding protein [Bdellovibrionales bacterium]
MAKVSSTKLLPIEFAVFRSKCLPAKGSHIDVGVSGGLDSMALLRILVRLRARLGFQLRAVYVHHGETGDAKTLRYRERARAFVEKKAKELEVPFLCVNAQPSMSN